MHFKIYNAFIRAIRMPENSSTLERFRKQALEGDKREEQRLVQKSLKYSIADGMLWAGMDGFGNKFVTALAVGLKASNWEISLLSSLPSLASAWAQLLSGKLLDRFKSRKKIIAWFVLFQAFTWLPLGLIPLVWPNTAMVAIILFYTLCTVFGAVIGPIWQSWMGDLVPENVRGDYHGKRNQFVVAAGFAATLAAGFLLNWFPAEQKFYGFALLFFIAFLARMVSREFVNRQFEPRFEPQPSAYFSLFDFVRRVPKSNFGQFSLFIALLNLSVNLAGPFFIVYWLTELHFSYAQLTIALLLEIIGSFVMFRYWGKLADRFGNTRIMLVTGALVPLIPFFYLLTPFLSSTSLIVYWVCFFSGVMWAGFNLSAGNFMYDAVSPSKRHHAYAYHNIFVGTGLFVGAIVGGILISTIPPAWYVFSNAFLTLFVISGIARYIVYFSFIKRIREVRTVEHVNDVQLFQIVASTNPVHGFVFSAFDFAKKGVVEVDDAVSGFFEHVDEIVLEPVKKKVRRPKK